jgi:Na+-translocating ferredoxin:NAD+ oxidoreductase RnfD subunit
MLHVAVRRYVMTALTSTDARIPADEGHLVDESEIPTTELVKDAINQAKELTKLEIALAKDEMMREIAGFKSAAVMLGVAAGLGTVGITLALVAAAFLLGNLYIALGIGAAILVAAAICASAGWSRFPKKPMGLTAGRLQADVRDLKERMV